MSYSENYPEYDVRAYFETVIDENMFNNKSVLDFGCNRANFLRFNDHNGSYTGVDIYEPIITSNISEFPSHSFIHYDGYNQMYNPNGTASIPTFSNHDIGIMFSVANHMQIDELKNTINHLNQYCDKLYVTYFSSHNRYGYDLATTYRNLPSDNWTSIENQDYYYHTADNDLMWSYYADSYLQTQTGADSVIDETRKWDKEYDLRSCMKCLVFNNAA